MEQWSDLAERARENLDRHGADNVQLVTGDGSLGLSASAPFDAIVVSERFQKCRRRSWSSLPWAAAWCSRLGPGGSFRSTTS